MVTVEDFGGFLVVILCLSVPLSAILAVVIRSRYRKAVSHFMMAHSGAPETAFDVPPPAHPNSAALEFDVMPMARRPPLRFALAGRYLLSGLVFAALTTTVLFFVGGIEFARYRFTIMTAVFALPAVVMALYVCGLRWYLVILVSAGMGLFLYGLEPVTGGLMLTWVAPACLLAVIVGNPLLRTTAIPLFMIVALLLVVAYLSVHLLLYAVDRGALNFLLSYLSVGVVKAIYLFLMFALMIATGFVFTKVVAGVVARMAAGSSEFMMQHDLLWLFQAVWMVAFSWPSDGPAVTMHLLPLGAYRAVLWLTRPRGPAREINLLLRVFGHRKRQTGLARSMLLGWRMEGPLLLIGSADLATETLDGPELSAFLNRRLSDIFIDSPEDLAEACNIDDTRLGDGLFPVYDDYCRDNSWRPTVLTLMSRARRVLVDMRGFQEVNSGIRYEIRALAERVPAERIIVIVEPDAVQGVEALFSQAWSEAGSGTGCDRISFRVDSKA